MLDHTFKVGRAITEGAIWDMRRGERDTSVQILRVVDSRIGPRLRVRGLTTGREWCLTPETLLSAYRPRTTKKMPRW